MGDDEQPRINTYNMCRLRLIDERIALYVENSHVRLIPLRATLPLPLYAAGTPLWVGSPLAVWTADANPLTVGHETAWCIAWSRLIRLNCTVLVCHPPPSSPLCYLAPLSTMCSRAVVPANTMGLTLGVPPPPRPCPPAAVCQATLPPPPVVSPPPGTPPASIYLYDRPYLFMYKEKRYRPCLFVLPVYVVRACGGDHGYALGVPVGSRGSATTRLPQCGSRSPGVCPRRNRRHVPLWTDTP